MSQNMEQIIIELQQKLRIATGLANDYESDYLRLNEESSNLIDRVGELAKKVKELEEKLCTTESERDEYFELCMKNIPDVMAK